MRELTGHSSFSRQEWTSPTPPPPCTEENMQTCRTIRENSYTIPHITCHWHANISMTQPSPTLGLTKMPKIKSKKLFLFSASLLNTTPYLHHHNTTLYYCTSFPHSCAVQYISLWRMHPTESQANRLLNHAHQRSGVLTSGACSVHKETELVSWVICFL